MAYAGRPINEDQVLPAKCEHDEYKRLYAKLQAELEAENALETFCTHEAGHLIFFRRAGFTKFDFEGPTMTYRLWLTGESEADRYNYYLAAVHVPEVGRLRRYNNDDTLKEIARGAVAGEMFNEVRQNRPSVPVDKSSDYDGFNELCLRALRTDNSFGYDAPGRWKRARDEVKDYLGSSAHEQEIQDAIVEVRFKCFSL
jgi:hypothetical protein